MLDGQVVRVALAVADGSACALLTNWLHGDIITVRIGVEVRDEDPGRPAQVGD